MAFLFFIAQHWEDKEQGTFKNLKEVEKYIKNVKGRKVQFIKIIDQAGIIAYASITYKPYTYELWSVKES